MVSGDTWENAFFYCGRLVGCEIRARQAVASAEWLKWASETGSKDEAAAVKAIILDDQFWTAITLFYRLLRPMRRLRGMLASDTPTLGKVSDHSGLLSPDAAIYVGRRPAAQFSTRSCNASSELTKREALSGACRWHPGGLRLMTTSRLRVLTKTWRRLSPVFCGTNALSCTAHFTLLRNCWNLNRGAQQLAKR